MQSNRQRAKMVVSDSLGLVNFAIGLVDPVLNLPDSPRASSYGELWRRSKKNLLPLFPPPPPYPQEPQESLLAG